MYVVLTETNLYAKNKVFFDFSCDMVDGSGEINLSSLGNVDNSHSLSVAGADGFLYYFNPCYGFNVSKVEDAGHVYHDDYFDLAVSLENLFSLRVAHTSPHCNSCSSIRPKIGYD